MTNENSGTVSVIDTTTDAVVGEPFTVGSSPGGLAVTACPPVRQHPDDQPSAPSAVVLPPRFTG